MWATCAKVQHLICSVILCAFATQSKVLELDGIKPMFGEKTDKINGHVA